MDILPICYLAHFHRIRRFRAGVLCLLFLAIGVRPLFAQEKLLPVFHFQRLSVATGLSSNLIGSEVVRDRNGFIWVGTLAGLDRYDGYTVKHYRNDPEDPHSLSSNIVYALILDSRGRLWAGHYGTGLSLYDPSRDYFVNLPPRTGDSSWYNARGIYAIREDPSGQLWLATENGGVVCVEMPDNQETLNPESLAVKVRMTTYNLGSMRNFAHDLCMWNDGRIFVGSDSGIVVIDPATRKTSRLVSHDPAGRLLDSCMIFSITPDGKGALWVTTSMQGAFLLDPATMNIRNFRHREGDPYSIKSNSTHHIRKDPRGNLWIATEKGLDLFDPATGRSIPYLAVGPSPQKPNCDWISVDNTGTLWIDTEIDGLYMLSEKSLRYPLYSLPDANRGARSFEGIERDNQGRLWISARGEVLRFDFATLGVLDRLKVYHEEVTTNGDHDASASYIDADGIFWYGSNEHGLYNVNLATGRVRHFTYPSRISGASSVRSIAPAGNHALWIGTRQEPLMRFDCITEQFTIVQEVSSPFALQVIADRQGGLWVAAEMNGVIHFDPAGGFREQFMYDPDNPGSLGNGLVYKSYQDPSGRIWVGAGAVMNLWDPSARKFIRFPNPGIAPRFFVYPLSTDVRGRLLYACDEYFSVLDPSTGKHENFDASDGFTSGPVDTDTLTDGRIIMTGDQGINIFSADSLTPHREPPLLVISELSINDKFTLPPAMHNGTGSLHLDYTRNVLEFQFAATDIVAPSFVQYRYRLEGLDKEWVNPKDHRYVRYAGLQPGEYVFKVKAVSTRNEWPDQEIALSISIAPPWWLSAGAYVMYALLTLALVYAIYRARLEQLRLKQQAEMDHFQAERFAEVDKLKSRFFANVSHEFRTPLTLIMGPSEDLLSISVEPATRRKLDLIRTNARKLQDLVIQLLDLSRLESGAMKLSVSSHDIVRFLYRTTMSFESWAERKRISLEFHSDVDAVAGFFDGDKLQKIVNNLLSNALKFTAEGGTISVSLRGPKAPGSLVKNGEIAPPLGPAESGVPQSGTSSSRQIGTPRNDRMREGDITVSVSDTGPGISADHLPHIFDRFFRVDEVHTTEGTGIGLALTKELVDLHHGTIEVESTPGEGSLFTLTLPVNRSAYREEEISGDHSEPQSGEPRTAAHPPVEPPPDPAIQPAEGKAIVLIVEDNPDLRLYIREHFESEYAVREAADGKEGFDRAAEIVPDLVISDVMMPAMNGMELCRALKRDVRTSHVPVILLTARAGTDSKIEGLETGADDYLTKPFDVKELSVRARNLIEQRRELRKKFSASVVLKPGEVKVVSQEDAFLKALMKVLEERIGDENLSVENLGEALHMSRVQLHRKVTALTNLSASGFIRSMRLHRAMELLKGGGGTVSEIAYRVGFRDPSHFSRRFHDQFGITPIDVIRNSKNLPTDNAG